MSSQCYPETSFRRERIFNAEDTEERAEARRGKLSSAHLSENLRVLGVKIRGSFLGCGYAYA